MTDCALFRDISALIGEMIDRSRRYYRPSSEGIPEPSLTDALLFGLSCFGHRVSIWVPGETKTGADLDLIIIDPKGGLFPFCIQAKKLKTSGRYEGLNSKYTRGYQADLLCARAPFYPLYLFYNFTHPGVPRGCAIADGHAVSAVAHPFRSNLTDVIASKVVAGLQKPWEILVCPPKGTPLNVAGVVAGLPGAPDWKIPWGPVSRDELPAMHRRLLDQEPEAEAMEDDTDPDHGAIVVIRLELPR